LVTEDEVGLRREGLRREDSTSKQRTTSIPEYVEFCISDTNGAIKFIGGFEGNERNADRNVIKGRIEGDVDNDDNNDKHCPLIRLFGDCCDGDG